MDKPMSLVGMAVAVLFAMALLACGREAAGPTTPTPPDTPAPTQTPAPSTATAPPATPTPAPVPSSNEQRQPAPELQGIAGWINTEPLTIASQRGKVVLVDFWTYTCVNCIRTLPYLKQWHEKYAPHGLVIIGVHTPEFEFEKVKENVEKAVREYGLQYAIAQDNDYGTWNAFSNRYWPAKYLIDREGYVRFVHFGEGKYQETEQKIRELLQETGAMLDQVPVGTDPGPQAHPAAFSSDIETVMTRELYGGVSRNYGALLAGDAPYVLHEEYYNEPNAEVLYQDPGSHRNHFIYLQGLWRNTPESLVHARQTESFEDYIAIKFYATSVNAVMSSDGTTGPIDVRVTLDGAPLTPSQAGADVQFDQQGNSFVQVDGSRMYRLVEQPEFGGHELRLSANVTGLALYAFTFGAYGTGP